ncbi:hypothetical protein BYT27DRAFT_6798995 [Phlegmacium glaucopus]|nr:hypothetical protein BYT27DRAFT_6798995 [Phlegmacium glaucopus]
MQLLKFFERASLPAFPKYRKISTRLSPNRLSQPFSQTPTTSFPSNSVAELASTKNTTRTVTSLVSQPISSQESTSGRPQSSEVESKSSFTPKREIINPRSPATQFGIIAGVFLRHTARSLGFLVLPDGYIRVSDMLTYNYFGRFKLLEFAHFVKNDPMDRFEMTLLPDLVDGILQKVWWVRAKYGHSMPEVNHATQRICRVEKLPVVYHITRTSNWDFIRNHGIPEGPGHFIRLFDKSHSNLFHDYVPVHAKALCISVDPMKAAAMGVKFFYTKEAQLIATGDWNQVIPLKALKSVVELEFTKETLK